MANLQGNNGNTNTGTTSRSSTGSNTPQGVTRKGTAGSDTLLGTAGDDTLIGGAGNDTLVGREGADTFVFDEGHGKDTITDFNPGTDIVDLSRFDDEITWNALKSRMTEITNPNDPSKVMGVLIDLTDWGGGTIMLASVTSVDKLTEDMFKFPAVNVVDGTGGDDMLSGTIGIDRIYGGGGDDILIGLGGNDKIEGGAGNDTIMGGAGKDELYGGSGGDMLYGSDGRDTLYGDAGNDWMDGAAGRDRLIGGRGNDTLWGDRDAAQSADTFVFGLKHGNDTIKDFANGVDKIDLRAFQGIGSLSSLSATQDGANVVIDLTDQEGGGKITLENVDLADLDDDDFIFNAASQDVDGI